MSVSIPQSYRHRFFGPDPVACFIQVLYSPVNNTSAPFLSVFLPFFLATVDSVKLYVPSLLRGLFIK